MTAPNGCAGKCCALLCLSVELAALRRLRTRDAAFVADMLVPLDLEQAEARALEFGVMREGGRLVPMERHFMCRHWDEATGLCSVYAHRPEMCRRFPAGGSCGYEGCGYRPPPPPARRTV